MRPDTRGATQGALSASSSNQPDTGTNQSSPSQAETQLASYVEIESEDRRGFRTALAVAAVAHLSLLLLQLPEVLAEEPTTVAPKRIHMMETVRFLPPKPEPDPPQPPKPKARKVPIPDPTPNEPEPIRSFEPEPIEVPDPGPVVFIPDVPPPIPDQGPTGPLAMRADIEKPIRTLTIDPRYTEIARRARIQGVVILQSTIDADGNVVNVTPLKGLPMGLTEAAVSAVKQWRFEPAKLDGRPVAVYFNLTVSFRLQ